MKKIIAICNPSGGVGKTTIATNLAKLFSRRELETLVTSLDPREGSLKLYHKAGFNRFLGLSGHGIVKTAMKNIDIIPAKHCYRSDGMLKRLIFDSSFIEDTLQKNIDKYNIILFDAPPSLNEAMYWVLSMADWVLIPAYYQSSIDDIDELIQIVDETKEFNPSLEIGGIVISRSDRRSKQSRLFEDELSKAFGKYLMETKIPHDPNVKREYSAGKTIVEYAPDSPAAKAYSRLAKEIIEKWI